MRNHSAISAISEISANSAIYIHLSQKWNQQNLKNQSVISGRHWLNCIEHKLLNVHGKFLCKYVIIFLQITSNLELFLNHKFRVRDTRVDSWPGEGVWNSMGQEYSFSKLS